MLTEPSDATMQSPRWAGRRTAPHVPSLMMAIGQGMTAWHSRTVKSMFGMPICVLTMLTGVPSNSPGDAPNLSSSLARTGFATLPTEIVMGVHRPKQGALKPVGHRKKTLRSCKVARFTKRAMLGSAFEASKHGLRKRSLHFSFSQAFT